ncbi:MAG TPA: sulfatase [Thermoanaerobaculales bacterium]|mgnify:FL=1|nr:sulfatase [Thermoanaerobaculales bacterium]HQN94898.1 sulfatase [Thermoanaerobaculales bacterium]HQP43663.1 sulfatase [Thermoanaerobaculales bacterium]
MPRSRTALAVAGLLGILACAPAPERQPPAGLAARFIVEESPEAPRPELLYDSAPVFSWSAASQDEAARWRPREVPSAPAPDGRPGRGEATGSTTVWERPLHIEADAVDRIELRFAGRPPGAVALSWAGTLRRYSTERSTEAEAHELSDGSGYSCGFDLQGHPWWTGRMTRVRFGPFAAQTRLPVIAVTGSRFVVDPDRLAAAASRPWKVEIDHDARNALLVPPGLPAERRLQLPDGARLRFGYGLQRGVRVPVQFEVTVTTDGGDPQRVFARRLDARRGDGRRWHEAEVSLAGLGGRQVAVRLSTRAGPGFDPTRGLPAWANPEIVGGAAADRPNVVVVCLDTLRADRLSCYGHALPTSPRIDAWAAGRAALFSTVVATSPWTLPSHVSMFTGLDAVRHGVNHYRAAPASLEMLAERLREAGYATAAITGGGYLRPQFGLAQGFDRFVYWPRHDAERELAHGMRLAIDYLENRAAEPFFLFFHTYEVHYPHLHRQPYFDRLAAAAGGAPPSSRIEMRPHGWRRLRAPGDYFVAQRPGERDWRTPLTPAEVALVSLLYDSGVAYADAQVGRLIDRIDALGPAGRTVLIVTSDHGEALGEDGRAGHSYLEDYNVLVPLLVGLPDGRGGGRRIDRQVRLTDLAPTILDAAGVAAAPADGVSLLHLVDGAPPEVPAAAWTYAASSNRGLALRVDDRLKYTFNDAAWRQIHGEERLVDLERDPAERVNLAARDPRAAELRALTGATLLAQHRGPRLAIRNRGPHQLRGRLEGAFNAHDRLKASAAGGGTVRWRGPAPPTFAVGPGQELTLLLSSPDRDRAGIIAHLVAPDGRRGSPVAEWLDLSALERPLAVELGEDGDWRRIEGPAAPPGTGFLVWWEGGPPESASAPDGAVTEQLRALGYLE